MIIWESSGSHLGVIWESSGGHLGDIWESVGIILPIGMIYPTSPPNHPGSGTGMPNVWDTIKYCEAFFFVFLGAFRSGFLIFGGSFHLVHINY